jgi:hypothetical protein
VQAEGRALVVAAELEAPDARLRLLVALDVHLLDHAAELAHAQRRCLDVLDREEHALFRLGARRTLPVARMSVSCKSRRRADPSLGAWIRD